MEGRVILLTALAALAVAAAWYLDKSTPLVVGVVDKGTCGAFSYSYTTAGVMGLAYLEEAAFRSTGPGPPINAVSLQLNAFAKSGKVEYWVQNVLLITYFNGTYYLAAADYVFNVSDYGRVEAKGGGNVVRYRAGGRTVAVYQNSATIGEITLPAHLGLRIVANGSALYFYYEVDGAWRLYDVVELPDAAVLYVAPGRELEWVIAGPREGYTAEVAKWSGWMALYYEAGGKWYVPPCAYSGSESPPTAERISPVKGLAEYAEGDKAVQRAGRSAAILLWSPQASVIPAAGGLSVVLTPPSGQWTVLVNGTEVGASYLELAPGTYNITAILRAGDAIVYRCCICARTSS